MVSYKRLVMLFTFMLAISGAAYSQQYRPDLYSGMQWRLIGPYRAGRVTAVAGIPGNPAIYYMGTPGGGVWRTTDGGDVWNPIFDGEHVASIGAVALAPSDPKIIYVGTGEQTLGNGVYRSTDAGATWTNIGLKDSGYISSILVDPRDPNIVLVGVLGQANFGPDGPTKVRGVFKTTDGGKTWKRTLFKDEKTGVSDMCFDPGDRRVVYAGIWGAPLQGGQALLREAEGGLYKSTDEGATWKEISGHGLPTQGMGRVGVAVAPGDRGRRVFAIMSQGLFRSDDAGENWKKITKDPRVVGNGYFSKVYVDPRNTDVVYVMQTSVYRSADGGVTFEAYKGAPGGDDYHALWIDPQNSDRMILGVDQGATISLDGGKSWSSWYNQPTAQLYHVSTDNQFPYYAYAAQQDSGTVVVPNRSDFGEISYREWFSSGGFEFSYIAPDPLDPNFVYSGGWYGSVVRLDKTTWQAAHVFERGEKYRTSQIPPLVFSPTDLHTLYLGTQYVLETSDRGMSWQAISPDLTVAPGEKAEGKEKVTDSDGGAALFAIAPSPVAAGVIWAGTSNGLVQLTRDGGHSWTVVTPTELSPKAVINIIEASKHDAATAYVAAYIPQDPHPFLYRTRDFGKSWQKIVAGLPETEQAAVVREDGARARLLYAGTEIGIFVSFDDGDNWQSLQLNLPTSPVRDLAVHGDDLVVATYGRSIWILDDLTPLRQLNAQVAAADVNLFAPQKAIRVRWDNDQETALPPEVPAGKNPPDGAIIDYYLKSAPSGDITLKIFDSNGYLVRSYSSAAQAPDTTPANAPEYWFAHAPVLPKNAGMNRFTWDFHYPAPPALLYSYYGGKVDYIEETLGDHSILGEAPRRFPEGPLALPGRYEVELTVDGKSYRQALDVELDPRVHVAQADLAQQLALAKETDAILVSSFNSYNDLQSTRDAIADRQKALAASPSAPPSKDAADALAALDKEIKAVAEGTPLTPGIGPANRDAARLATLIEEGDIRPSDAVRSAVDDACHDLKKALDMWRGVSAKSLAPANTLLEKYKVSTLPAPAPADPVCGN